MKKQILFLCVIIFFNYGYSQDSKTGIIYYNHIDNHYNESYNSYLVFNQNASHFVTAKDSLGLSNDKKNNNLNNEDIVEAVDFDDVKKTREEGFQVFFDRRKNNMYSTNAFTLLSKLLYIKEKKTALKWVFTEETKKIGAFTCNKATTKFRGRDYICWYTQEIPLPYGPWKLQGLPGIILEAKSKDGFFKILFKKIKYPIQDVHVPLNSKSLLKSGEKYLSLEEYKVKQKNHMKIKDNSLKIMAKKYNVQVDPFSERLNFLEIFGF